MLRGGLARATGRNFRG